MKWIEPYLAVPYLLGGRDTKGWDCWGAIRHVLEAHAGLVLPMYDRRAHEEISNEPTSGRWLEVPEARMWDVITMLTITKFGRFPFHVGLMVSNTWMLHCEEKIGTVCVRLNDPSISYRIEKIYRHKLLV
jgi:hypothetical protein